MFAGQSRDFDNAVGLTQIDRGLAVNVSDGLDANLYRLKYKIFGTRCLR